MKHLRHKEKKLPGASVRGALILAMVFLCLGSGSTSLLSAQGESFSEGKEGDPRFFPDNFLNGRQLSSVDEANDYYAQVDPRRNEVRSSCAVVDPERLDRVELSDLGVSEDHTPGLQIRLFFDQGDLVRNQTRLIASSLGGGVHIVEDGFSKVPTGRCLEYLVIGATPTLESWLDRAFGPNGSGDFATRSLNKQDLGFGRYTAGGVRNGDVFTYVQNFTTLQGAIDHPGPRQAPGAAFATVVIEYSRTFPGSSARTLKYFVFKADGVRTAKLDLDGGGQKYVPKVCSVCHSDKFIPIDLESQTFGTQPGSTRAAQEEAFYQLNQIVLQGPTTDHFEELVDGWYLSGHQQNSDFVPDAWQSEPELYLEFVKPYCRGCHVTQNRDWFSSPEFVRTFAQIHEDRICNEIRPMPNALVTWALLASDPTAIQRFEEETGVLIRCLRENVDLQAEIVGITPAAPVEGDNVTVQLRVRNVGDADFTEGTIAVLRYTDPAGLSVSRLFTVPYISAAGSRTFSFPLAANREGTWTLEWTVDPNDDIDEYPDVRNNEATLDFDVAPGGGGELPNLSMLSRPGSIQMSPSAPEPGDVITFTIRIFNEGPGDTPAGQTVFNRMTVGTQVSLRGCSPIAAGRECVLQHTVIAQEGLGQRIRVVADHDEGVDETDEHDNERSLYFNVSPPSSTVTCRGTWHLTGVGHGFNSSAVGSLVDNCDVYWGENLPTSTCFRTTGIDDIVVTWFRDGNPCPVRASAFRPRDGQTFLYEVQIEP